MHKFLLTLLLIAGFCPLNGQVVSTLISQPGAQFEAITWAPNGNIFTLDFATGEVFKLDIEGNIEKMATLNGALGGAVDAEGNFYCSEFNTGKVIKINNDNEAEVYAEGLFGPSGILIDTSNQIMYVANYAGNSISKINMLDTVRVADTLAIGGLINGPDGLVFDENGDIISANFNNNGVQRITPTGEVSSFTTIAGSPNSGYLVRKGPEFIITGANGNDIHTISADGTVSKLTGAGAVGYQDGSLMEAQFNFPNGIAISPSGDSILITESSTDGRIRLITGLNLVSNLAPSIGITELIISPNPASNHLTIQLNLRKEDSLSIRLMDSKGALIQSLFEGKTTAGPFNRSFALNTQLSPGLYILQLSLGSSSIHRQLIVQQ